MSPFSTRGVMRRLRCRAGRLCALALLCFQLPVVAQQAPAPKPAVPGLGYLLQPGDELVISVQPQKGFDTEVTILPDGRAFIKSIGKEVEVAGKTTLALRDIITKELEKDLVNPVVSVNVKKLAFRAKVTVSGAVEKASIVELEDGLRVRKAIELSGGATREADLSRVTIIHKNLRRSIVDLSRPERVLDPEHNLLLTDGDSVDVPRLAKITVNGAVDKPGTIDLVEGLRVQRALELVGGPLNAKDAAGGQADLAKVLIVHKDLTRHLVNLSTPENLSNPEQNLLLRDGDSIQVPLVNRPGFASITGAVITAGPQELKPGASLADLVFGSGRPTPIADLEHVQFRRPGQEVKTVNLAAQQEQGLDNQIRLMPGDEVFVPETKEFVIIIGATDKPGPRPLQVGQKISEFFTQGGRFSTTGTNELTNNSASAVLDPAKQRLEAVQILRRDEKTRKLDLPKILREPQRKENLVLKTGDVILLPGRDQEYKQRTRLVDYLTPLLYLFRF